MQHRLVDALAIACPCRAVILADFRADFEVTTPVMSGTRSS